jgi:PAS domain S-box-containing protein
VTGLKGLLRFVGFGAIAYVTVIAAVIGIKIAPMAKQLRDHSERVRREYQAISDRSAMLYATMKEIRIELDTVARSASTKPGLDRLRRRIDSLTTPASAPQLSGVPTSMRVEFANSSMEQSQLGVMLVEVLANMELGRIRPAQQQLVTADSIARSVDRHLAAAQRVGLDDLIAREQALAEASRSSIVLVGWWAGLGLLIAPVVFVLLHRRFYGPLEDLADGIQQVADGDLTWTIPVRHSDELGRLSQHFNRATAVLRQREEETRDRAQAALRQSEARYETMVESAPIGIAVVDSEGRYLHTNPALQRFLGYSESELRGMSFRDVTAPEDVPDSSRRFALLLSGGTDRYHLEKRYRRKDGALVWARVAIAAVRNETGTLVHTVSMIEDITDEKALQAAHERAEEARRKSERMFATAFRNSPNPSVISRLADGVLVDVNDAYCTTSGFTRDEVLGKAARDVLYPAPEGREEFLREIQQHGRVRDLELRMRTKSGPPLEVLVSVETIELDGVTHTLGAAVDITNRNRAAQALKQSEEKFAKAFRASPNSIVISELESGVLVDANDAFFATTGYSRDEAVGRSTRDLIWLDPQQRAVFLERLKTDGRIRAMEVPIHTKSGEARTGLVSAEIIELAGRRYLLTQASDITESKRATEALRESELRFRRLVQGMTIGVALLDADGGLLHANPAAREILALTDAEAADPSFWKTGMVGLQEDGTPYPTDERPVLKAIRTGSALHNLLMGVPARGRPEGRWALVNVDPQVDTDGSIRNFIVWFSDVTEQRKADEQLRLLAQAVKSTSEMITITDSEGHFTFVNRAFLERTGYSEDEVLGRTVDLIVSPRNPAGLRDEIRDGTARGGWSGELYNRDKHGNEFAIALTTAQVRDAKGRVIALMGVASDITDRKRAARALQESEERYRSLVDASPDAISVVQDRRILFANPAAFDLVGARTPRDVIGRFVLDFVAEQSRERVVARLDAVLAGGRDVIEELKVRRLDGSILDVEAIGILITFQGRPAVLAIHRDVTARKQAEQQLRLLVQGVKSIQESISITDVEGNLTFVNRSFAETYGYTEAELLGKHVSLIDSPRNPAGLQTELVRVTATRGTWTGELYNRRKDGTDFLITLTTAQVKDPQGNVIALMGVASDITGRKQLEESLRRSQTMSALGAVVAGVAHEVRNPLFAISATVDAFEARFGAEAKQERYSNTLRREVNRLTKLMQDLLEYGKPPRLDITRGDVAPVLRRAIAASTPLAESSGITIVDQLDPDLPQVLMDSSRIQQVFQNLLDNAIQHSPPGTTVSVIGRRNGAGGKDVLEITFTDHGSGFRDEDLPRLFEPFFSRRRGGTGLGLSIVQRILEQHDGEVVARNGAEGGAVIAIRLPLERDHVAV